MSRWLAAVRDGLWHHDCAIDNGPRARDPEPYLAAPATGAAIARALSPS